jgi:hypothetical protein
MTRSGICTCLALYDWDGEIDTVQFHDLANDFFEANGVLPNLCGVTQLDGSSRNTSYKIMAQRLRSEPLRDVDALELYHTLPDYAQLIFGWDVTAALHCHPDKAIEFCCGQAIRGLDLGYFEPMLERIGRIVALKYGIGYLRSFQLGPDIYAYGMVTGLGYSGEAMAEADRIGSWFRERMEANRHLAGCLRDVYPLNVISQKHLAQRVDGSSLADWIGASPARGTLRSLPGGATLWRIDESNIEPVRAALVSAGLLIAYLPRA